MIQQVGSESGELVEGHDVNDKGVGKNGCKDSDHREDVGEFCAKRETLADTK